MLITMSNKEIQRLAVLQDVRDHRIIQVRAAEILNLSTRQITPLLQKPNQDGVSRMAHASRGQAGHHRHDELDKQNKRSRSKKSMPSRKAQKVIIEQEKLNSVLVSCG